jgi:hypothetical protein
MRGACGFVTKLSIYEDGTRNWGEVSHEMGAD